jgi:hypothetical protein
MTVSATSVGGRTSNVLFVIALVGAVLLLDACSSAPAAVRNPHSTTTTADAMSAVDATVLAAWKTAENAFYQAEADPNGLASPLLPQTMVDPELELVKTNLAGNESEGFIGEGTWDLGSPRVVSLGPSELDPTTATVVSCVHDTAILVHQDTGKPASGLLGTPDWAGETSVMVVTPSGWKLSQQSAALNTQRQIACAGI